MMTTGEYVNIYYFVFLTEPLTYPLPCLCYVSIGVIIVYDDDDDNVVNNYCMPDEEELIYFDGTIVCRQTKINQGKIIHVEHCHPGEEEIIYADGTFSCLKMENCRVVRKNKVCEPGERIVKRNGNVFCRKNRKR